MLISPLLVILLCALNEERSIVFTNVYFYLTVLPLYAYLKEYTNTTMARFITLDPLESGTYLRARYVRISFWYCIFKILLRVLRNYVYQIIKAFFQGWFNESVLYYGTYSNETISERSITYKIPNAYFCSILFSYVFILILIAYW